MAKNNYRQNEEARTLARENAKLKQDNKILGENNERLQIDIQYARKEVNNVQQHPNKATADANHNFQYIKQLKARNWIERLTRKYE